MQTVRILRITFHTTLVTLVLVACNERRAPAPPPPVSIPIDAEDSIVRLVSEAQAFVRDIDPTLRKLAVQAAMAQWANETNITKEHEAAAAKANEALSVETTKLVKEARKFDSVINTLDPGTSRQLLLLKSATFPNFGVQPSPDDPKQASELAQTAAEMTSIYGKGVCTTTKRKETCLDIEHWSKQLQKARKPADLLKTWTTWHDSVGRAERDLFTRYVDLANAGAKAIGFANVATLWQSNYDMPVEKFAPEVDRLWGQVKPLYEQLHCYTRRKLHAMYGSKIVPPQGPIPAHLLGNMWAQSWEYLYPELEPYKGVAAIDVTPVLAKKYDAKKMVEMGEGFYTSLGMDPLPKTFWERSMFTKPANKDVVCHASAWDVQYDNDLRIKMCINPTQEDLFTIHHELGHLYYYHSYFRLQMLYQSGANDGFHEAIGDAIELSITPDYLKQKGLLDKVVKNNKATINQQMRVALGKIAFLPFGLLIDKWRWDVFSGAIKPAQYNQHWWDLKKRYQGVSSPVARAATDFDPGAKFHVAGNVPYMRYFLAHILQFQFHRALCKAAGISGPLHECSIYNNKAAGAAYMKMLALGASKPWQDALEQLTGAREMDASAILDYFAPLRMWLEAQNKGKACGW